MNHSKPWTELDISKPIWSHFHLVAPLFVIGTTEANGDTDFAPKHLACPMSWDNYFGFVCSPTHATYKNIERDGVFTVSAPRPDQVVLTSLAATTRCADGGKPLTKAIPSVPATTVPGRRLRDAYFALECSLTKMVDGLGSNVLIIGEVVAARLHRDALASPETNAHEQIHNHPLLAFLAPDRFAEIHKSYSFPFPRDFKV